MNELARHSRAASDTRMGSLMFIMGVFLIAVMIVFSTTDAVPMGVDEGERDECFCQCYVCRGYQIYIHLSRKVFILSD